MTDTYMPLCTDTAMKRHLESYELLKLELKIASDGYPELSGMNEEKLCRLLRGASGKRDRHLRKIYESAAAVYCHSLYFKYILKKDRYPSLPEGRCADILGKSFGSPGNFFYLVRTLAGGTSVPGFLWLYRRNIRGMPTLGLARLPLYTLPDLQKFTPLMCIDLWEHAYIDRWGTDISGYADANLRQIDWDRIFAETPL